MDKCDHHADLHLQGVLKIHAVFSHAPVPLHNSQIAPTDYLHPEELVVDEPAVNTHKRHEVKYWSELKKGRKG